MRQLAAILLAGMLASCSSTASQDLAAAPDWSLTQSRTNNADYGWIRSYEMTRTLGGVTVRYAIGVPESDSRTVMRGFAGRAGDCRRNGDASLEPGVPLARRAVMVETMVRAQLAAMRAGQCPIGLAASGVLDGFRTAYVRLEQMALIDGVGG